jgi:hypothetical protein
VTEGASLAQALREFPESFPDIFCATVAAGEQSGHLDSVLDKLADYAESSDALRQKVLAALAYPLLLTIVAIAVVTGLLGWVVPQIVGVFENMHQALPWPTRALIALSAFVRHWGWLLVLLAVAAVVALRLALRREAIRYRWHATLLRLPLVGRLVRAANTARATRTLALLAGSAVPLLDALGIAAQVVPNLPMRSAARRRVQGARRQRVFARARRQRAIPARRAAPDRERGTLGRTAADARGGCAATAARTRSLDDGADFGVGPGGNPRGRCDGAVHRARDPAADFRFEPDGEIADRRRRICRRMHAAKPGAASTIERDAAAVAHPEFPPDPGSR